MVIINVLVERDTLFLKWVTGQTTDETGIFYICVESFVVFLQLSEGVNDNSKDNV